MRTPDVRHTLVMAAAAGLLAGAACKKDQPAPTAEATPLAATDKACCKGKNECKGKGGCAVPGKHDCAGKNECKGKGGCDMTCPPKK